MHILVHLHDPEEQAALCRMLQSWVTFSCLSMQVLTQEPQSGQDPAILFWDLDGPVPPVLQRADCALILCSQDPQRAIGSYCFHPAGFLAKPIRADRLWAVMSRCAPLWFSYLERLEVFHGRDRFTLPLHDLIWAEGQRRGCLLHTTGQAVTTREPLYRLEDLLPRPVFQRCHRSFLVNVTQIRQADAAFLVLQDGTKLPLARGNKAGVLAAYHQYRALRHSR